MKPKKQTGKPSRRKIRNVTKAFELAAGRKGGKYILNLYVAGATPHSLKAIDDIKKICDEYLQGMCELKIIDIYQQPLFAHEGRIVAAPTLIKKLPLPLKRFIGDMSNLERVLVGLDIHSKK